MATRDSIAKEILRGIDHDDLKTLDQKVKVATAYAFAEIADQLYNLGTRDASTPMGALEMLACEIKDGFARLAEQR